MLPRPFLPVCLAVLLSSSLQAAVLTLDSAKDNAIVAGNANNSNGGGPAFFAGTDGNNSIHRALVSFDLGGIPSGATITSVQLTLTLAQVAGGGPGTATIGLFDLTQNWGEGTTGSTFTGLASSGQGLPAATGDATWNAAFFQQTSWTNPGGDHAGAASASLFLNNATINNTFTWLSTPQLVADVQGWVNNPSTNFGWELINANETTAKSIYGFYSNDWHSFTGGNLTQEPALQVTYSVPEPAAAGLLLAGFGFLPLRRRRR
jgi:hypothetical protein